MLFLAGKILLMSTILCISSYYKGYDFLVKCKELENHVILVTSASLKNENWPWDSLDEVFYMEEIKPNKWNTNHLILGIASYLKTTNIDAIVALDDYDVGKAAKVRETFRIAGMGLTTYRYFRDKLAMREKAYSEGIKVPNFTSIFNNDMVNDFAQNVPAPWVLKPRSEASASGIVKIQNIDELWENIHKLGDERYRFLLEQFRSGDVYHVDSLVYNNKIIFSCASKYKQPPMAVSHQGGVFMTASLDPKDNETQILLKMNEELLTKFGLKHGATHSEFIKDKETGDFIFLETASRVGGAFIPEMVEQATGINLWYEWAEIENALLNNTTYKLPQVENNFGGLLVSLSKVKQADLSFVTEPEFSKQLHKDYHVGMLFKAENQERIHELLNKYSEIVSHQFLNIVPPKEL